MSKSPKKALTETQEDLRLYQQEQAILEVTEQICQLMEEHKVSRVELARRLGKTKGMVSQLLDGAANMTIRTIADVFTVLGYKFELTPISLRQDEELPVAFPNVVTLTDTGELVFMSEGHGWEDRPSGVSPLGMPHLGGINQVRVPLQLETLAS